jgi:hypothetical protein
VAPGFTADGVCWLPYIHDLYVFANLPPAWLSDSVRRKIDAVVRYVLADEYQRLPRGYGYIRDDTSGRDRYYVLGWNVDLPGHVERPPTGREQAYFIQRLELMSCFERARRSAWWSASMGLLQKFRTPKGDYLLPRRWLQEKPVGYWVTGAHMGLEESRRSERSLRLESTLRALRLLTC